MWAVFHSSGFGPSTIAQLDKGEGGQFIAPGERWETVDWCVVSLDTVGPSQDVRWIFHVSGGLEAVDWRRPTLDMRLIRGDIMVLKPSSVISGIFAIL